MVPHIQTVLITRKVFYLLILVLQIYSCANIVIEKSEIIAPIEFYKKDSTNSLSSIYQKLKLDYVVWGCACAPWIEYKYRSDTSISLSDSCFFIEPANGVNISLDSFNQLLIIGQFYTKKDYPKNFLKNEEPVNKSRVFQYKSAKIVEK